MLCGANKKRSAEVCPHHIQWIWLPPLSQCNFRQLILLERYCLVYWLQQLPHLPKFTFVALCHKFEIKKKIARDEYCNKSHFVFEDRVIFKMGHFDFAVASLFGPNNLFSEWLQSIQQMALMSIAYDASLQRQPLKPTTSKCLVAITIICLNNIAYIARVSVEVAFINKIAYFLPHLNLE